MRILISRTDNIGDVVLSLPICGMLKQQYPDAKVFFLGKSYTRDIIKNCKHIDGYIDADELLNLPDAAELLSTFSFDSIIHLFPNPDIARIAKLANIRHRIGTSHRFYHWFTCNKRVNFSRKNSNLHEAQLNFLLLKPLGISVPGSLDELSTLTGFNHIQGDEKVQQFLSKEKFNLIIHPKTKGSAEEWGLDNFKKLLSKLKRDHIKMNIIFTGSEKDKDACNAWLAELKEDYTNTMGELSLGQLIALIQSADGLIANSTGPVHIAAISNVPCIGLFSNKRPIHPGRWSPLGHNAKVISLENNSEEEVSKIPIAAVVKEVSLWLSP